LVIIFIDLILLQDPDAFQTEYDAATAVAQPAPSGPRQPKPQAGEAEGDVDEFTTVGKGGKVLQFTADSIFKNLQLVQEARGKKVSSPYLAV
jgi:translation initiation factor 3 subunit C